MNIDANKNKGWKARTYDGTIKTAVIQDDIRDSKYYDEYKAALKEDILERIKDSNTIKDKEAYAEKTATIEAKDYLKMNIGDGQGYISFESYRMLKYAEGAWSNEQENLYLQGLCIQLYFPNRWRRSILIVQAQNLSR